MSTAPGLLQVTQRVEDTSGRGAAVFREAAPLCVRYCQQTAISCFYVVTFTLKVGHQDPQYADPQKKHTHLPGDWGVFLYCG